MSTIEKAIEIAAHAHAGDTDKAGMPYIFHPLRVMMAVKNPKEKIAGVLHDTIEDTVVA
jgi:guanosine-3',5'-bis(diphosphate) 3'-pyrophosphohydrolase